VTPPVSTIASTRVPNPDVRAALATIERVFKIETLLESQPRPADPARYYQQSLGLYFLVHCRAGAVHFALDGNDFAAQVDIISHHLRPLRVERVLEIASGTGYNAVRLARMLPGAHLTGLDLTPISVRLARLRARRQRGVRFECGDFHDLPFDRASFDGVCAIEGFCHARDLHTALSEVARVLRPGGRFIAIDGFLAAPLASLAYPEFTAVRLIDSAFAITRTWTLGDFLASARTFGLRPVAVEDLTARVLPNVNRMARIAQYCLVRRRRARAFAHLLPSRVIQNEIAAILLPEAIGAGAYGYWAAVLQADAPPAPIGEGDREKDAALHGGRPR
jgi:SAM-dependent methyltransferase